METRIEKAWGKLHSIAEKQFTATDLESLEQAYNFARKVLGNEKNRHGEVIIEHALDVAIIVAKEIGLGVDSVISGLLHNLPYVNTLKKVSIAEIEERFGHYVGAILLGMEKISRLGTETVELHPENFRKLMLALAGDVRVILIKIADRLQVMRQLSMYGEAEKKRIPSETVLLYAPLAHRLGLYNINSELLDLGLKYNNPEAYNKVYNCLAESEVERNNFVAEFVKPIEQKLKAKGFNFKMKARTKAINSIWNKMKASNISFDEIFDIFAIRVILDSPKEDEKNHCWQVYSIVTEEYQANPKRMRDWISTPKENGYESLHATVFGPQQKWVEVQIRTKRMDEVAEKGVAAHWKYKGGTGDLAIEEWLAEVRNILEDPENNVVDFIDEFNTNIYSDEIFIFTPKGDLKRLPKGATILDFAYEIHSDVGDKCVGGMVDGRKVNLRYKLKNGEQVSVDTSNNQKAKMDWLDFAVTSKAKNRIKASLNEERKREAQHGKEMLERKMKNWKIEYNDEVIRTLLKHYKFKLAQDLYYDISVGKIDPLQIKQLITEREEEKELKAKQVINDSLDELDAKEVKATGSDYLIIDNNVKNVTHKLSPCCNPILGDEIFGFVTINEGIKIHRKNCSNAAQMFERYPYRIIPAKWCSEEGDGSFQTYIKISGKDEMGMTSKISTVIANDAGVAMRSINLQASNNGDFDGTIRVFVSSTQHLSLLLKKLLKIKGVRHASRVD